MPNLPFMVTSNIDVPAVGNSLLTQHEAPQGIDELTIALDTFSATIIVRYTSVSFDEGWYIIEGTIDDYKDQADEEKLLAYVNFTLYTTLVTTERAQNGVTGILEARA